MYFEQHGPRFISRGTSVTISFNGAISYANKLFRQLQLLWPSRQVTSVEAEGAATALRNARRTECNRQW